MKELPFRSRFLDMTAMSRLARLRFHTRHTVEGARMGRHAAARPGGAAEFADYREYAPGDDLRKLDWKVLGRLGRAVLRTFRDETRMRCTLVLDASGSMLFGALDPERTEGSKLDFARYLLASLAFVIATASDEVGLAVVAGQLDSFLPPGAAPTHLRGFLDRLDAVRPEPATRLSRGLSELFGRLTQRGVLVVVSDFLDDDLEAVRSALRRFRHRHFEIVCLHVLHPQEVQLPDTRACRFTGLEGEPDVVTDPRGIADRYAARFGAFMDSVKAMALSSGCDYRRAMTDAGHLRALEGLLAHGDA